MNLSSAFINTARRFSQQTALYWGDQEYSFRQLWEQSEWCARELQDRFHIRPGDRVGLWLKNRPEFIPALYGILRLGAIVVPINSFLKPSEVVYILQDSGINMLVTESAFDSSLPPLASSCPQLQFLAVDIIPDQGIKESEWIPAVDLDPSALGLIIYTSGTTGHPKGAMLSHGNLLHNVDSCRQLLQPDQHDRFVLLLPMFHSFMLCVCIFLPTLIGSSIVLIKSVHPPKAVIQEMLARRPTILPAIPQFFRALTDPSVPADLPLRLCISGAAPLPGQILQDFNRKFPFPLLEGYGLSEASPVVSLNPVLGPWKDGSIGVPIPDVEVRIRGNNGDWLPAGQIGELCVRGGNVMQGYWNQSQATTDTLIDGWLLTGDVGYYDADGYFYITDRKKDMLLVNGINVYPREIEEVIYQYPGVKEAAVVGQIDSRKGEQPVAFVAMQDEAVAEEKTLLQFLRERLADYKVPRKIFFEKALPRNATGKILKTTLRSSLELPSAG